MSNPPSPAKRPQRLLSIDEAAEFFLVSSKTVRRWIASGKLRAYRLGRQWRIAPEDVASFLSARANWKPSCFAQCPLNSLESRVSG